MDMEGMVERVRPFIPNNNKAAAMREICADLFERYAAEWSENEQYAFLAVGSFLGFCEGIERENPQMFTRLN